MHQNRVQHGALAKNCLQESDLPSWLDLVVWGHEHECITATEVSPCPRICAVLGGQWWRACTAVCARSSAVPHIP